MAAESIYAVLFSSGLVKVGRAHDASRRIEQHVDRLVVAGITAVARHSMPCIDSRRAERALIKRCELFDEHCGTNEEEKNEGLAA